MIVRYFRGFLNFIIMAEVMIIVKALMTGSRRHASSLFYIGEGETSEEQLMKWESIFVSGEN